ncbi:hypothetical protein [Microbulbifer sp. S227A]|uniref:hypothetical protein n=1 Tax=Microbulbifer sp. S227A TaxID=3415131 RepID=UPI003C79A0BF
MRVNIVLGAVCVAFAGLVLAVWIPMDTEGGVVARVRGDYAIGDALAPTLAGGLVLLSGLLLILFEGRAERQPHPERANMFFIGSMFATLVVGGLVMRYAGPVAAWLFTEHGSYRQLRDTIPWKYLGFVLGGTLTVAGMISIVEGRPSWRGPVTGLLATLVIAALYDLPFEDLLLPPNGDF